MSNQSVKQNKSNRNSVVPGHWIVMIKGIVILAIGVFISFKFGDFHALPRSVDGLMRNLTPAVAWSHLVTLIGTAAIGFGALEIVINQLWLITSRVTVFKDGLEWRTGFFNQKVEPIRFSQIESASLNRSLLGRLLNYGTVTIYGIGSGVITMPNLKRAESLTNFINRQKRVSRQDREG